MSTQKKHKILVVEDEDIARDVLCRALSVIGYDVAEAENGRVAYDMFNTEPADVILSDINMPEMTGTELLERIRSDGAEVPIILITGYETAKARAMVNKYKNVELISKPYRLQNLQDLLNNYLAE